MKELALHIMDVMQNSITAESTKIEINVNVTDDDRLLTIIVKDNGCGMDPETLEKATDPFHTSRTTRLVGLGLPMFKEAALLTGGDFKLESQVGRGTVLTAEFVNASIDRQPLGELGNVFFLTMLSHHDLQLMLKLTSSRGSFSFASWEFAAALERRGESPMDAAFSAQTLIDQQVNLIFKDVLPEIGGELHGIARSCEADQRPAAL